MDTKRILSKNPWFAGLLSLFIPGLGQMYAGQGARGAAILAVVIVAGSLNAIWLSLYNLSDPAAANSAWTYYLPRILHDLFALYGIVLWIWAFVDAFIIVKEPGDMENNKAPELLKLRVVLFP